MNKQILLMAGAALLFSGTSQAGAPETQADREHSTIAQKEAPAPIASDAKMKTVGSQSARKGVEQERPNDAKPVYLDGGYFGGSDN